MSKVDPRKAATGVRNRPGIWLDLLTLISFPSWCVSAEHPLRWLEGDVLWTFPVSLIIPHDLSLSLITAGQTCWTWVPCCLSLPLWWFRTVFGLVAFEFFCLFKSFSLDTFSLSQLNIHFYFGILNQYRTHNLHQKISSSFNVTQVSLQLLDP